jgi:GNAT superfamily N-acetyltransferase
MADFDDLPQRAFAPRLTRTQGDEEDPYSTADILGQMNKPDTFPDWLKRQADKIPESGRTLEPRGPDESLFSYWKRAADALSVHDMAKGGVNTVANWLGATKGTGQTATPGEGYGFAATGLTPADTLAPTGGIVSGAAVGTKALAKPSIADHAAARYLEWKHPDELVPNEMRQWPWAHEPDATPGMIQAKDPSTYIPHQFNAANQRGKPSDRFRLLADDQASTPGLLINSLPMDEASRLNRAREMGFDTENKWYHGTAANEIDAFDASRSGKAHGTPHFGDGVYFAPWKSMAEDYRRGALTNEKFRELKTQAESGQIGPDIFKPLNKYREQLEKGKVGGGQVLETHLRMQNPLSVKRSEIKNAYDPTLASRAAAEGYDGLRILGSDGLPDEVIVFDPKNIRRTDAAFNPLDSDKAGLLLSDQSRASVPGAVINSLSESGFEPGWYHGTRTAGFSEFSTDDTLRANSNNGFRGVSMTRDPNEASGYTGVGLGLEYRYSKDTLAQKLGLKEPTRSVVQVGHDFGHGKGAVYPLAVKIDNPFIWDIDDFSRPGNDTLRRVKEIMPDYNEGDFPIKQRAALSDALLGAGYDAIDIVSGGKVRERAAFKKGSIKSATTGETLFSKSDNQAGTAINALGEAQKAALPERAFGRASVKDGLTEPGGVGNMEAMGFDPNKMWYHGSNRADRLVEKGELDPKRATSGPMPYFTDNPEIASNYAKGKPDTSRMAMDEGNVANYFTVSPKDLGYTRGRAPYTVEQSWYHLSPEQRATIMDRWHRIGYENRDMGEGPYTLHPDAYSGLSGKDHYDWTLKNEARGNPLTALRNIWHDSGSIIGSEADMAEIWRLAGYPHKISQSNAPWTEAPGVLPARLAMKTPLETSNVKELTEKVIPALEEAFKRDRTRRKEGMSDAWDKNERYTPREWLAQLKEDTAGASKNSFVWTSIPDKVTEALRRLGYDGILDTGGKAGGDGHTVAIPFDKHQVRSPWAKFDPKKADKGGLLLSKSDNPTGTAINALAESRKGVDAAGPRDTAQRVTVDSDGAHLYNDGRVTATVVPGNGSATILEFSSHAEGKGNAAKALADLRTMYGDLYAQDPGSSASFWKKMTDRGLLAGAMDENGDTLWRAGPRDTAAAAALPERAFGNDKSTAMKTFDFDTKGGGHREAKVGDTTIEYGVARDGQSAEVILVKTPKEKRGQGSARAAMEQFIREADETGKTLFLNADPMDKGVSKPKLDAFYKSLGFVKNTGKNKDFTSRAEFVRPANPKSAFGRGGGGDGGDSSTRQQAKAPGAEPSTLSSLNSAEAQLPERAFGIKGKEDGMKDMYAHKLEGLKDMWGDVHVRKFTDADGRSEYKVFQGGHQIGSAKLDRSGTYVSDVDVRKDLRRRGIAAALYDHIEKDIGKGLEPSPLHQTGDGQAFWKGRR